MVNLNKSVIFSYCHGNGSPSQSATRTVMDIPKVSLEKLPVMGWFDAETGVRSLVWVG